MLPLPPRRRRRAHLPPRRSSAARLRRPPPARRNRHAAAIGALAAGLWSVGCAPSDRSPLLDCIGTDSCTPDAEALPVLPDGRISPVVHDGGSAAAAGPDAPACTSLPLRLAELLADPEGADGRGENEFVEIQGPPGGLLRGHTLRFVADEGDRVTQRVELEGTLGPNGLFVVGGSNVAGANVPLRSAIRNGPDRAELLGCADEMLDQVGWARDAATRDPAIWVPRPPEGQSLLACAPEGDAAERWIPSLPSPGTAVPHAEACAARTDPVEPLDPDIETPGTVPGDGGGAEDGGDGPDASPPPDPDPAPDCVPAPEGVRISEVLVDEPGVDTGDLEFVEIAGPTGASFDVRLEGRDGNGGRAYLSHEQRVTLNASGLAVLRPDTLLQNGPDSFVLSTCDDRVLDRLAYGTFRAGNVGFGFGAAPPTPAPGRSLARCPDANRSDTNRDDFHDAAPTPGQRNSGFAVDACATRAEPPPDPSPEPPASPCVCDAGTCVRRVPFEGAIAEVLYDNEGADHRELEFIEVFGQAGEALDGLTLVARNAGVDAPWLDLALDGLHLDDEGRAVIGATRDVPGRRALPTLLRNGPATLALVACGEEVLDEVAWGRWPDDSAPPAPPITVAPGQSVARCEPPTARTPTIAATPSPGRPNQPREPDACGPPEEACGEIPGWLLVNEVGVRGMDGSRDDQFVEIAGPLGQPLDDVLMTVIGPDGLGVSWNLWGTVLGDGYFVVATPSAPPWLAFWVDDELLHALGWPRGAVQLEDCEGRFLDAVAWGDWAGMGPWGWGRSARSPEDGGTIGRDAWSRDTRDNASDFERLPWRTPGEANP